MQVNNTHSNQTFGAISFTPYAEKVVKGRIKTKSGLAELDKLIESQKNNPVNIGITTVDGRYRNKPDLLSAQFCHEKVSDSNIDYVVDCSQNIFASPTTSPIVFLREACKKAVEIAKSNGLM